MRKNLFFYLFAVLCTVSLFSSCSDDDDVVIPIKEEIAGNYKGTLNVYLVADNGTETSLGPAISQIIAVAEAGENAVSLSITDFSFLNIPVGNINLNNCTLVPTDEAGVYGFTGTTKVSPAALTADVDAEGVFDDGDLDISLDIDATLTEGNVQQHVTVVFEGRKMTGNESSEAKITSFIFDRNVAEVDSLVLVQPTIDEANKTITFMVADTAKAEYLTALVPTIQVSAGATVTPESNVAQNFSENKQVT